MIRVAIVEDSKTIRESLTHFVQTDPECCCVFACATAEEALAGIPKHQPEVVLMDIQLPKLSGIDCTAQIKKILPAIQVIMVTVYEDTDRISAALRAGACGYLLKRCTPAELVSAVREARMGGVPMPREIARKVIASFQQPPTVAAGICELRPSELKNTGIAGNRAGQQGDRAPAGLERRNGTLAFGKYLQQVARPFPHGGVVKIPLRKSPINFSQKFLSFAVPGWVWEALIQGFFGRCRNVRLQPDVCQARQIVEFGHYWRITTARIVQNYTFMKHNRTSTWPSVQFSNPVINQ